MRMARISKGGQIQVPAEIRRRWGTDRVIIEDDGVGIWIEPLPDDPIAAAMGSLKGKVRMTSDEARRQFREEEREAEERKWGQ
jgi:bifunctional DNA-binding transcriptional regulator/antitoxin component of YhaV-PrlF toxin-antitoxin module